LSISGLAKRLQREEEKKMKYLCLAYYDEQKFDALSVEAVNELVRECATHDEALRESGHLLAQASLGPIHASAGLRPRQGEVAVTVGPYAETREQIGAFFILEADNREEAIALASLHPAARLGEQVGWGIELRPIESFQQM
jgi:hypothetical protein